MACGNYSRGGIDWPRSIGEDPVELAARIEGKPGEDPYPDGLAIVSKVAARRDENGAVLRAMMPQQSCTRSRTTCARSVSGSSPPSTCG